MQVISLCISILFIVNHVVNCALFNNGSKIYKYVSGLNPNKFEGKFDGKSFIDGKLYKSIMRYSYSEFRCQKGDEDIVCYHYQKKIRVSHSAWDNINRKTLDCKGNLSSSDIQYEYFSMLKLNESRNHVVELNNCPLPETSYDSLFSSSVQKNKNSSVVTSTHIKILKIYCQKSHDFLVTKNHLEGLTSLLYLDICCEALKDLPNDLFHETIPEIIAINIHNSGLKVIKDGLFRNLKKLEYLILYKNSIATISADAFSGSFSLSYLIFHSNRFKYFSGGTICKDRIIEDLNLGNNQLNHFPKGLNVTGILNLSQNNLSKVDRSDCIGLTKLIYLDLHQNRISSIDPSCFSLMVDLIYLELSGNFINIPYDTPLYENKFITFELNDNSIQDFRVRRYFISQNMMRLEMRNSNIISLEENSFEELPNLWSIDLSMNHISAIPVNLFKSNKFLIEVQLQKNRLTHISSYTFLNNELLKFLDLSSNNLTHFNRNAIAYQFNGSIYSERISMYKSIYYRVKNVTSYSLKNFFTYKIPLSLDVIPYRKIFLNMCHLKVLNVSHNNIKSLNNDIFFGLINLQKVEFSYNLLSELPNDIFHQLKHYSKAKSIQLQRNSLASLPDLDLPHIRYLDLSENNLQSISEGKFHKLPLLEHLNLSKNYLRDLPNSSIVNSNQLLQTLDLSHNLLQGIPKRMFIGADKLTKLNLSHNHIKIFDYFDLYSATNLRELNFSSNIISEILHDDVFIDENVPSKFGDFLKVLDLSNNSLVLKDTEKLLKQNLLTLGAMSPFSRFRNLEVLLLSNNSIENIFIDWRISLPRLRLVDMRFNKINYLTYHDMLFSTTRYYEDEGHGTYSYLHNTTLDLRNNQIRGIELPNEMLQILPEKNESIGFYGHVTVLLDDNPFECGCQVFNLLKVLHFNVALRSELFLMYGDKKLLAAMLDIGNLSCSTPSSIKGKKLKDIEEWIYHLLPMFGICYLEDMLGN